MFKELLKIYSYREIIKRAIFISGIFLSLNNLYSQRELKYSNDFLELGVGANSIAMANSVVANVNDVTAGYWNPAGLMGIKSKIEIALMHDEYLGGIAQNDYLGLSYKYDSNNVFGLTVIRFGIDNLQYTFDLIDGITNSNFNNINPYTDAQYGILISYARSFNKIPGFTFGGNVKIIRNVLGDFASSRGTGLDAGIQYKYKNWLWGAVCKDISSTINKWNYNLNQDLINIYSETGNQIPENGLKITLPSLQIGVASIYKAFHKSISLMPELGADITIDGMRNTLINSNLVCVNPHFGIQIGYKDRMFLRLGAGNIQTFSVPTGQTVTYLSPDFGVGIKVKALTFDYALSDNTAWGLYSNIFSIKLDIK